MNDFSSAAHELLWDQIADALVNQGYIVLEQPLPESVTHALLTNLQNERTIPLKRGGIGRNADYQLNQTIRGDMIHWLESDEPGVNGFLTWMDRLRSNLNQRLFMGLVDYESHYAVYSEGTGYKKHIDAFKGKSERKVSTVFYLNRDWVEEDGGALVLYQEAGDRELERIAPKYGRLVIFLSEKFPHEVQIAKRKRLSIAGWFRITPL